MPGQRAPGHKGYIRRGDKVFEEPDPALGHPYPRLSLAKFGLNKVFSNVCYWPVVGWDHIDWGMII